MAKMSNKFFKAPWIVTAITCPKRGATIFQVLVVLAHEAGLDSDKIYDEEEHLIDKSLEWGMLKEDEKSELYRATYKKVEDNKQDVAHFFVQSGLMKSRCRNELKKFS